MLASPQAAAEGGDAAVADRLTPPETGSIPVAFVITPGATVIDFTGPWEVSQDAVGPGRGTTSADTRPFRLFTVKQSREAVRASAGLQIVPDYTFADAPEAKVIVVPAQGSSPEMIARIKKASAKADVTMSVCVGSFILANGVTRAVPEAAGDYPRSLEAGNHSAGAACGSPAALAGDSASIQRAWVRRSRASSSGNAGSSSAVAVRTWWMSLFCSSRMK